MPEWFYVAAAGFIGGVTSSWFGALLGAWLTHRAEHKKSPIPELPGIFPVKTVEEPEVKKGFVPKP